MTEQEALKRMVKILSDVSVDELTSIEIGILQVLQEMGYAEIVTDDGEEIVALTDYATRLTIR